MQLILLERVQMYPLIQPTGKSRQKVFRWSSNWESFTQKQPRERLHPLPNHLPLTVRVC